MWGLLTLVPGVLDSLFKWLGKRAETDLDKFKTATGIDLEAYKAFLIARNETNAHKVALTSGRYGLILIAFGLAFFAAPTGLWWWALTLDSLPLFGHEIGSWRIAEFPGPNAEIKREIILSFFVTTGALSAAGIGAALLRGARR